MKTALQLLIVATTVSVCSRSQAAPVTLVEQEPVKITTVAAGVVLVDFGKVAFGNLKLLPSSTNSSANGLIVRFGEALKNGRVDRNPPGSVRYAEAAASLHGTDPLVVAPSAKHEYPNGLPNVMGTGLIKTPKQWGVLIPFRWVEIEGWEGALLPSQVLRLAAFAEGWDDHAAAFHSSNEMLNRIWDLCRYSLKATTFAGLYIDGDRERCPYEADAYIDQIGCYYSDPDPRMARDTFEFLLKHPTWPTEWAAHMIFMLHADWMQTGDLNWLSSHFDLVKPKLLESRLRPDGLIGSSEKDVQHNDIIDWPGGERDGYKMSPCNTVVNAFTIRSLALMAEMARALGRNQEAADYGKRAENAQRVFQEKFFDPQRGIYVDGELITHASAHANFIPLAFGLVPPEHGASVIAYIKAKGMPCSVYGAQYLLEGLFQNGEAEAALALMAAPGERSWRHMVDSGATITWEAWDQRFKPNQDWNHAWATAPANLLPRYVLGILPAEPGWKSVLIRPNPAGLETCQGTAPTPRGPVSVSWVNGKVFALNLTGPSSTPVSFDLPGTASSVVRVNGAVVEHKQTGVRLGFSLVPSGPVAIEVSGAH